MNGQRKAALEHLGRLTELGRIAENGRTALSPVPLPPSLRSGRWTAIAPAPPACIDRCNSLSREPSSLTASSCGLPRVFTLSPLSVKSMQPYSDLPFPPIADPFLDPQLGRDLFR